MARESRKRGHGSAVDEDPCTPRPNTRSRTVSSNQHGGPPESQISSQEISMSFENTDLQDNALGVDEGVDNGCSPSSQPPRSLPSDPEQQKVHQMGGGSLLQCPTSNANNGQSTGPGNRVRVYHPGCSPFPQRAACPGHFFLEIFNPRKLFRSIEDITYNRDIKHPDKVFLIKEEIWEVVKEAHGEFNRLNDQVFNQSACEERRAASLTESDVLGEDVEQKVAEDENPGSKRRFPDLNLHPDDDKNSGHELELGFFNQLETMPTNQIFSAMKSMTSELEKRCPEHASRVDLKPREANGHEQMISRDHMLFVKVGPGEANGQYEQEIRHEPGCIESSERGEVKTKVQLNPICGSYTDDSATPHLLGIVFSNAKAAVTRFQKALSEGMKSSEDWRWDQQSLEVFFARPKHVSFYVKAIVNSLLFKRFENESFGTSSGISRYPDPTLRQEKFYEYFQRQKKEDVIESDPQFAEFCKRKGSRQLWKTFQRVFGKDMEVNCLDELASHNLDLKLKEAAKSVWLLHKVAFAFEPPASIFRVEQGVDVDQKYMETIVNLNDHERFVAKVGFMITPGLRLRESVYPCEVYLSAEDTTNVNSGTSSEQHNEVVEM